MRIIGGIYRGRKIKAPPGKTTRPTADMVREAIFNILNPKVPGCVFLDVFAGTGAVGLEALSRGANFAVFIEQNKVAYKIILENLKRLDLLDKSEVLKKDALEGLKELDKRGACFDIIFLDPPYYESEIEGYFEFIGGTGLIKPRSIIVWQHASDVAKKFKGFDCIKEKKYGRTIISFLIKEEKY